ncbi:MAG: DnaJ domain-containing protein [Gammaproteobacteria bacterium]
MSDLLKRLEIIRNALSVGDEDVAVLQAERLPEAAAELSALLAEKQYAAATKWIGDYRKNNFLPAEYADPETAALRLELESLEGEITALAAEKAEMERVIAEFNAAFYEAVGPILEKVLQKRARDAERAQSSQDAEKESPEIKKARRDYEEYRRQTPPQTRELDDAQKAELKQLYQRAALKCHPDKLPDDKKEEGKKIFQELEPAYRANDLERVRQIWERLQAGVWTASSAAPADKNLLRRRIAAARGTVAELRAEIAAIRADEVWRLIESLGGEDETAWAEYFARTRKELEKELL